MKTILAAFGLGTAVEAAWMVALFAGGFGPCGPASPLSGFVIWIHAPGLVLTRALHFAELTGLFVVLGAYAVMWSGIALLILTWWSQRSKDADVDSQSSISRTP